MGKKEKKAEKEAAAVAVAEEPAIVKVIISNLKKGIYMLMEFECLYFPLIMYFVSFWDLFPC